ncbi:hypothetical protein AV530_013421 [Patagioenas fasciata monilis]|uniref:Uncharacterized protein n=1 Tax=Patagioenas fasciata monilis TaxID=372326 RepID=A0A1V4JPC2_PATFA|nr:hypothetical protein AV530_013421 [Patagioenas fasciata monilis]
MKAGAGEFLRVPLAFCVVQHGLNESRLLKEKVDSLTQESATTRPKTENTSDFGSGHVELNVSISLWTRIEKIMTITIAGEHHGSDLKISSLHAVVSQVIFRQVGLLHPVFSWFLRIRATAQIFLTATHTTHVIHPSKCKIPRNITRETKTVLQSF